MVIDFDFDFLRAAVALVDGAFERLEERADTSPDPDAFGIFDEVEYLTGFGFVACQTYMTAQVSCSRLKKKKLEALALGPNHRTGRSIAQLVNAAANYWKHSPDYSFDALTPQQEQTCDVIKSLGVNVEADYPVAGMLHVILASHQPRFARLIPLLIQWRDALPK